MNSEAKSTLKYLGMERFQKSKLVRISQDDYTVSLKSIAIQNNDNEEELSESEYTNTKRLIGQLN